MEVSVDSAVGAGIKVASLPTEVWSKILEIGIMIGLAYVVYYLIKKYLTLLDDRHNSNLERLDNLEDENAKAMQDKTDCLTELRLVTYQLTITNERLADCAKDE